MTLTDILISIGLSAAPVAEVRGGIPYAILQAGMHPLLAFAVCTLANIAIVPIVFLILDILHKFAERSRFLRKTLDATLHRAQHKVHASVEKYGYWGLGVFVAIPLPLTGAYTGSIAAWALGMQRTKAFLTIATGVIVAGAIVTTIVVSGATAFRWLLV